MKKYLKDLWTWLKEEIRLAMLHTFKPSRTRIEKRDDGNLYVTYGKSTKSVSMWRGK